jgi:excisionase family DNA binding protein
MGLLTTKQTAERLGISIPRVHQLINEKRLPAEKVGRDYVIKEEDLSLVEDRKVGRPPKAKAESSRVSRKGSKK